MIVTSPGASALKCGGRKSWIVSGNCSEVGGIHRPCGVENGVPGRINNFECAGTADFEVDFVWSHIKSLCLCSDTRCKSELHSVAGATGRRDYDWTR